MPDHRPKIPEAVKRRVRQRCRFGCVLCGCPVYHYDHVIEYSDVREHEAENLVLLCGTHHDQKTRRQLPIEIVRQALERVDQGYRPRHNGAQLFYNPDVTVILGNNRIRLLVTPDRPFVPALVVDNSLLIGLRLQDGRPLLTLRTFDENNKLVLFVKDNELRHSDHLWDITYIGTKLTIRRALQNIFLEIDFLAPDQIAVTRGVIFAGGVGLAVHPAGITILNDMITLSDIRSDRRGIRIADVESSPDLIFFDVTGVRRYQYSPVPPMIDGKRSGSGS